MADAEAVAKSAFGAGMETFDEVLNILLDVVLPLVLGLAGVFTYSWLGGATSVASLITQAGGSTSLANHIGPLVPAAIGFGVGGGFWSLGRSKGIIVKAIGKLTGAYFLGLGFGYLMNAAFGNPTPGALDHLITSAGDMATGGK